MGRLSQLFWVLQAEEMPSYIQSKHHYTHLDILSPSARKEIVKLRREFKKEMAQNSISKDESNTP